MISLRHHRRCRWRCRTPCASKRWCQGERNSWVKVIDRTKEGQFASGHGASNAGIVGLSTDSLAQRSTPPRGFYGEEKFAISVGWRGSMAKRQVVELTEDERAQLQAVGKKGKVV